MRLPILMTLLLTAMLGQPVHAAEDAPPAPVVRLKVMGTWDILRQYQAFELPFWTETLPKLSGNRIQADLTPFNKAGLKGSELVRLMKFGTIDVGATVLSYISNDDPIVEGVDLAGFATDVATARRVADAFLPALNAHMESKHGVKVLAIWPYPAQVLLCNGPISGLDWLRGKRVRVSLRTTSDLIEAFGAVTMNIPFDETYAKIKEGSVDCLVTGTLSANSAKFYEVTTHLYYLPLGWSVVMMAASKATLDRMEARDRKVLEDGVHKLSDALWQEADLQTTQGVLCNTGQPTCSMGQKGAMTLVPVSDADRARLKRALQQVVVKRWAERCGTECAQKWSNSVGKIVNLSAP